MAEQRYKKPPITEAVIEVRFETSLKPAQIEKLSADFSAHYPDLQNVQNVDVTIETSPLNTGDAQNPPDIKVNQQTGQRRLSPDASQILLIWPMAFTISQLAPYLGWDDFFERFVRDWSLMKKVAGYRKIVRIGVRYLNRIDVPNTKPIMEESEYIAAYPTLPEALGPVTGYGLQAQLPLREIGCGLILNSGLVPSPLLGHMSFLVDIDIGRTIEVPQSDEGVYELLQKIRDKKNDVFELCITDRARELFQR